MERRGQILETLSGESYTHSDEMADYVMGVRERKGSERAGFNQWVKVGLFPETQGSEGVHGCTD